MSTRLRFQRDRRLPARAGRSSSAAIGLRPPPARRSAGPFGGAARAPGQPRKTMSFPNNPAGCATRLTARRFGRDRREPVNSRTSCWVIGKTHRFRGWPGARLHHQTVQRCVERAVAEGRWPRWTIAPALAGSLRSRWKRKPWLTSLSCRRRRSWVIRMNCGHAAARPPRSRARPPKAPWPGEAGAGHVVQILDQEEVKPHKVRYYLGSVILNLRENGRGAVRLSQSETAQEGRGAVEAEAERPGAIVSYDEKPGIQAIATTSPRSAARARRSCDLRPRP